MRTFSLSVLVALTLFFSAPTAVTFAQPQQSVIDTSSRQSSVRDTGTDVKLLNPLKSGDSLEGFLNNILDFIIRLGTIVVILMTVFVGYKFVAAQGEPGELSKAKSMLLWTIIGALVLLGAKAISVSLQATVKALGG